MGGKDDKDSWQTEDKAEKDEGDGFGFLDEGHYDCEDIVNGIVQVLGGPKGGTYSNRQ